MKVVYEPCLVCDGSGTCKNHEEQPTGPDTVAPCDNCGSSSAKCPICDGKGELDALYASYLLDAADVLRD